MKIKYYIAITAIPIAIGMFFWRPLAYPFIVIGFILAIITSWENKNRGDNEIPTM